MTFEEIMFIIFGCTMFAMFGGLVIKIVSMDNEAERAAKEKRKKKKLKYHS
jgi:hypothetical protein